MGKILIVILAIATTVSIIASFIAVGHIEDKNEPSKPNRILVIVMIVFVICNAFCAFIGLKSLWEFGFWFLGN